jgi:ribonuclease HII
MLDHVLGTKAAMTRQSLDLLRQRYVVEKRPLEASVEEVLRADTRAAARDILAIIDKRRSKNRAEGQRLRKMLRFETSLVERIAGLRSFIVSIQLTPGPGPNR